VDTNQQCLSFELNFPEIAENLQPHHHFMLAFEQCIESLPNHNYQYLLFAAEPYKIVAFKIPNECINHDPEHFITHWDADSKTFTLTLYFMEPEDCSFNYINKKNTRLLSFIYYCH
jgi:splicing factor 3A subunit 2